MRHLKRRIGFFVTAFGVLASARAVSPASSPDTGGQPPSRRTTSSEARDLLMEGEYERALEAYESLAREPAYAVEAALGLARCRLRVGRYEEAIAGLQSSPANDVADWHYVLATALARVGNYAGVLEHAQAAVTLNKDHAAARRLLGETFELLGRREEAIDTYRWFEQQLVARAELPRDAAWVTDAAVGLLRYSTLTQTNVVQRTKHVLNEMLQVAYERLDLSYWPARIAAADLMRLKYNNDEKDGSVADYQAALRINRRLVEAEVGLGEVLLENWNFEEVEKHVERALAVNPREASALHLLARNFIKERRYSQAIATAQRALAINPNDLVAVSLGAAGYACQYAADAVEEWRSRVASITPKCAILHRTLSDALSGIRQYAAAEEEFRKAIEHDPTDANARTELGMMYMQWGVEDKARDALDAAWVLDPFNKRTKFTLELLDSLQRFARHETEHFIVRYDAERDPGLGEYVAAYLEEIYKPVSDDYGASLEHKTTIELFPTQRAFGVRITGQPWIHTVGACTGRVIALASPRRATELSGPYNLARVLKHEFTHTVTLAATDNRIPHWLTEGLAVLQEDSPRPFGWCELLADTVRTDSLFTLESIDWGFMRPRRPNDRERAYAQSEWMCEYIVERFGYDAIQSMLQRFRRGRTQPEVFQEQFGLNIEDFTTGFRHWARGKAAQWCFDLTPPEEPAALRALVESSGSDANLLGRLARAEFDAGEHERALVAARRAVEIDTQEINGLNILSKVLAMLMDQEPTAAGRRAYEEEALVAAERLQRADPKNWTAPKTLADIALRRKEPDKALESLQRLQRLCPLHPASWRGLAGIYLQRGEYDLALEQLMEVARFEDHDPDIPAQIAAIHRRRGQLPEARHWLRQALYMDPFSIELHQSLGNAAMQAGDTKEALREYKMLTALDPKNPRHFENAAFAAHKNGNTSEARTLAREAVERDSASPARSLLP